MEKGVVRAKSRMPQHPRRWTSPMTSCRRWTSPRTACRGGRVRGQCAGASLRGSGLCCHGDKAAGHPASCRQPPAGCQGPAAAHQRPAHLHQHRLAGSALALQGESKGFAPIGTGGRLRGPNSVILRVPIRSLHSQHRRCSRGLKATYTVAGWGFLQIYQSLGSVQSHVAALAAKHKCSCPARRRPSP